MAAAENVRYQHRYLYLESKWRQHLLYKTGKQVFFEIAALKRWLGNRSSGELDYTQERAKLTRLQAKKVTLGPEQRRGNLLPMELVVATWQGHIANARAKLLALPPRPAIDKVLPP